MNKIGPRLEKIGKAAVSNVSQASTIAVNLKLKPYEEIPGPKTYPFVGSIFSLKVFGGDLDILNYTRFLFQIHEKYGDLAKLNIFNEKQVFIFKPEHAKIVFANEDAAPVRPSLTPWVLYAQRKKYSLSLVNSQGEEWKKQRSASNPIVAKPRTVASYLDVHNAIMDEFLEILNRKLNQSKEEKSIIFEKFQDQLKFISLEMMSIVAFDNRISCINESKTSQEIMKLCEEISNYSHLTADLFYGPPWWKYFRTSKWKKFEKASDYIYEYSRKYVMEAYEKLLSNKSRPANQSGTTMLEQFCLNQEKNKLSLDDIVSMMSEFLLASFDTTTTTLHNLITQLGQNQDIQEEIYKEINAAFPQNGFLDTDFFSKIPLLKAALKESLRLHNIAPNTTRILNTDIALDNYHIPKGSSLIMGMVNMAYSDKYYRNAKKFDPKRWLKNENVDPINPYTHLPFGFGARMCIGRRLAEQKIYLIMSKLIKNYRIEYVGGYEPAQFRLIQVPGNDLKIKLIPRSLN